ncbi:nuclear transport factor 2 family protein [Pseudonocardia nematodicida]|uniref:Nuclear transport factor 2 family protein n=1 Tax=Pseudonocardia nematodicida TaxID=1206997 RepID=A0ABV1K5M0_9PSEU
MEVVGIMIEDVASLSRRVQYMEDVDALRTAWHRFMSLFDRGGAHAEIAAMFAEDAVFESCGSDNGDRAWHGRASIESGFLRVVSPVRPSDDERVHSGHHGTTHEVRVDGDAGLVEGRFLELTGRGPGTVLAVAGTHTIFFRREGRGWLIRHLVIRIDFCSQLDVVEPRTAFLGKPPS